MGGERAFQVWREESVSINSSQNSESDRGPLGGGGPAPRPGGWSGYKQAAVFWLLAAVLALAVLNPTLHGGKPWDFPCYKIIKPEYEL